MTDISVRVIDCWVFRWRQSKLEFLLMKRSGERLYDGIWHAVHGKIKSGEAAWEAALREFREETSMMPRKMWVADGVSHFYEAGSDTMNLVPVFAVEVSESEGPTLSEEHSEYVWLTAEEAFDKVAWMNHRQSLERLQRMLDDRFEHSKWLEIDIAGI